MITLEQLLESRDRRAERQRSLLALYPHRTLLCLTVMLPGPVKRSSSSLTIASAAVAAVRSTFDLQFEELRDLETGYEGYFIVDLDPISAKRIAVSLEEEHPLPAGSTHSSTSGLSLCEQLERQAEIHSSTEDEA